MAAVAGPDRVLAGTSAVVLGLAYGLCLVSGLRQAEQMAGPAERGAVVACYYALAYLGFAAPYLADGLGAVAGKVGAFGVLAVIAAVLAAWTNAPAFRLGRRIRHRLLTAPAADYPTAGTADRSGPTKACQTLPNALPAKPNIQ